MKKHNSSHLPFLLIIVAVTLGLRIVPYLDSVLAPGDPLISDPDAAYHLRRVDLVVKNFPSLPVFDSYINHPDGAYVIWPPLYDLFLAAIWTVVSLVPGSFSPLLALIFVPPLLMTITCLIIYRMGIRWWPDRRWLACGAALLPAILPTTISYSYLGQLDHHAAELLLLVLFVDAFSQVVSNFAADLPLRRIFGLSWKPGLYLGMGLLVQHGFLFLEAIILLTSVAVFWKERKETWIMGAAVNAVAMVVILPFGIYSHSQGVPLAHTHFGGFQPLAVADAMFFYTTLWLARLRPARWTGYRMPAVAASGTATVVVGYFLLKETLAGAQYVLGIWSDWQSHIGESRAILGLPLEEALSQVGVQISWLIILLPLGWWLLYRHRRLSLLTATVVFVLMGFLQMRYLPYTAVFLGLMVAHPVDYLLKRWGAATVGPALALAIAAGYYPSVQAVGHQGTTYQLARELRLVLYWLRDNTHPTSNFDKPSAPGDYGVLAEWSLGHYIQYYARRPALGDNFGEHASDLDRLSDFFLSTDNRQAYTILDENKVRYVLTRGLVGTFKSVVSEDQLGKYLTRVSLRGESTREVRFSPTVFPTAVYRLTWRYGSAVMDRQGTYYPPLERLRLVAESSGRDRQAAGGPEVSLIKLYEYVAGCRLMISNLLPDQDVLIQGVVHTPHGRWFPYLQLARSDGKGNLSLTVPYTTDREIGIPYIDRYVLKAGEGSVPITDITNDMVVRGDTLHLSW